jgi:hypothetical protein
MSGNDDGFNYGGKCQIRWKCKCVQGCYEPEFHIGRTNDLYIVEHLYTQELKSILT